MQLSPDATDPQLPLLDPTQQRYELIRPLLLDAERTATQRAQETGTHPETMGRLKRRFAQQGMLGLVPDTLDVHPAQRHLRVPDTVVHELQRLKGLYHKPRHNSRYARAEFLRLTVAAPSSGGGTSTNSPSC